MVTLAACFSGTGPALLPAEQTEAGSIDLGGDAGFLPTDANLGDPFAIDGLTPSHGPFSGKTRARIDGRGFSSKLRVFVGGVEIDGASLLASDPTRAAIVTPPGPPGFVDVKIRDEATAKERVLKNGFFYDAFVVEPDSGATSGGTRIAITGSGTTWGDGTTVTIGGVPCTAVYVAAPTQLECLTPVNTPGAKDVIVTPSGGQGIQARDAFTYSDSIDGYRGGLSGGAISLTNGRVKVLAFDGMLGQPLPGAFAIASSLPASCTGSKVVTDQTSDDAACANPITQKCNGDAQFGLCVARDDATRSACTPGPAGDTACGSLNQGICAPDLKCQNADLARDGDGRPRIAQKIKQTAANGVTEIDGIRGGKATITVAAKCMHPITFVDVPVDTVTVYLQPVLDPTCIDFDPPSIGGGPTGRYGGYVDGQLIFPGSKEFESAGWSTVPFPTKPTERRAAYVFDASPSPIGTFQLPPATSAITPETEGTSGYNYSILVLPGNRTVYVIAGLEDRSESPPKFVPYAMGIARGVPVPSQSRVQGVDVKMDILFDHQVTIAAQPPAPGPRGPDRFTASVAMTLGSAGYAILPRGTRVSPLPAPGLIPFIGVPSLDHAASGEQYVLGGIAATGAEGQAPASVVSRVRTTEANNPVALGGFLGVPVLSQPAQNTWSGKHVAFTGATGPVDLSVTQVVSGGGYISWVIVAPGGQTSFDIPNLRAVPGPDPVGLISGAISTTVYVARIEQFQYGKLRYGHLSPNAWTAYAFDSLGGAY